MLCNCRSLLVSGFCARILLLPESFPLLGSLGFLTSGSRLLLQSLSLHLLCLRLVDRLDKHTLVLVCVTLGFVVTEVVEVLVNFLALAILAKQPSRTRWRRIQRTLVGIL